MTEPNRIAEYASVAEFVSLRFTLAILTVSACWKLVCADIRRDKREKNKPEDM